MVIDSDSLVPTPAGFTRYEKQLCRDARSCVTVTVGFEKWTFPRKLPCGPCAWSAPENCWSALPWNRRSDCRALGLRDDEQLKKQARYCWDNTSVRLRR